MKKFGLGALIGALFVLVGWAVVFSFQIPDIGIPRTNDFLYASVQHDFGVFPGPEPVSAFDDEELYESVEPVLLYSEDEYYGDSAFEPDYEYLYGAGYEYYEVEEYVPEEVGRRPMVALTFDDGPAAPTEQILDILELYDARATFFIIGRRLSSESRRETLLRTFEAGHEIANHTYMHQILPQVPYDDDIIADIRSASMAIEAITGAPAARLLRPPAGSVDARVFRIAAQMGYAVIMWSDDPLDWFYQDPDRIYHSIMSTVRDGSIVVLHDTHVATAQAMGRVVPGLIERGFDLVTVSELVYAAYGRSPVRGEVYNRVNFE